MHTKIPSLKITCSALAALGTLSIGHGQTTWDYSANPDKNWSTATNWSTDASPAGTFVVFGNIGTSGTSTTVGNIVDTSYTGGSALTGLTYGNTGAAAWQVTQIASGQTLSVNGSVRVGTSPTGAGVTTLAALTGSGTFVVSNTTSNFTVASTSTTGNAARATLDMSSLAAFSANVGVFEVGTGNSGNGTLFLSDNSLITSGTFTTGGSGSNYGSGVTNNIYFGNSTVLNTETFTVGGNRTYGTAQFRPANTSTSNAAAASNAILTIRGVNGVSAVTNMNVGAYLGSMQGSSNTTLNLTGGTVDALVTNLNIGSSASTLNTNPGAVLSMASGTFNATNVTLAATTSNNGGTGSITGTLDVSGGTFLAGTVTLGSNGTGAANVRGSVANLNVSGSAAVTVSGNVVMGVRNGAGAVTSTVNISGGTLLVQGNISEGAGPASITSSINLSGGTLDADHGTIAVDNFTFTGGTLKNVANFTAATTGGLVMQNSTLGFDNINDLSSMALNLTGNFSLSGTTNLSLSLANGFNPGASTIILVSNDGIDAITGTFATVNGAAGGTFTLTNDQGSFQYQLSYTGGDGNDLVAIAVPEPSTALLMGAGFATLLWRRRSRK
jgi:hypothetical protein